MNEVNERIKSAEKLLNLLLNSQRHYFKELKPSDLPDGLPVVYAVFDKETGEALYVG